MDFERRQPVQVELAFGQRVCMLPSISIWSQRQHGDKGAQTGVSQKFARVVVVRDRNVKIPG